MAAIQPFKKISFLFLFFLSKFLFAQSFLLSSIPAEEELSSRQITCFFQDRKGFMWIGTMDGLNLYNANSIKIFKHNVKDKNSLQNNYIQNICEDHDGNIWIGTATGVDRFEPNTNKFFHFFEDDQKKPLGYKCKVFSDRKGNIWVGCEGLFQFDPQHQSMKRIVNDYSDRFFGSRYANIISGFYNDSKGRYWISTDDGLFLYNDNSKTFSRFDIPPDDDNYKTGGKVFSSVYEDKSGNLYVGTWGYGLFKILFNEKRLVQLYPHSVVLTYASQQLNGENFLWSAVNGLTGFNNGHIQWQLSHESDNIFSLRNDGVSTLYTDKQGQLWIGFEKKGIQVLSPGNQLIKNHPIPYNKEHAIGSVGSIVKKGNEIFAGGWYKDALCKLDGDFNIEKWWKYLPPDDNTGSANVNDIFFDKNNFMWLATANGLVKISQANNEIKNYRYDTSVLKRSFFLKILPEGDSVFWLAGYHNGLSRFSLFTHKFELYNPKPLTLFWKAVYDKSGYIWCADDKGTLQRFDRKTRKFTIFRFDSLTEKSLYYDEVYDSASNTLWVASTSGLLRINPENYKAKLFTEADGLPTSRVNLLALDHKHRLWIATDKGLSLYIRQKNSFRNFYLNNGLITEKLDHSLSVGEVGKLYIGSDDNIMVMDIDSIENDTLISPVYITGISENGKMIHPVFKNNQKTIDLNYYQNNLSFDFAIIDFINSEDNLLLYKLDNWDNDFLKTKTGSVNYNKLPPGEYVFHVLGINHNGTENKIGDSIRIIIHPPFWKTTWFIILFSLVLLTILILIVRYVAQRNLKEKLLMLEKEQAVEKERNRISRDMHDDLGSGLTKIAIMSEVVKKQIHDPEKAKHQLENISQSSRELVDNLQDIIWILNPRNDTLENLAAYIREYSLKFFEPFETNILFDYPEKFPEIKLSEETRRNIFLVTKESFNNIAKHAWCNTVKVSLKYIPNKIHLTVKDDGKGFDMTHVRFFGNGLHNMQNRIEQISGEYKIASKPGEGTEIEIIIPV
jgi:signal transduction histidine kinase/ligand-binding sensor domain-containing protein